MSCVLWRTLLLSIVLNSSSARGLSCTTKDGKDLSSVYDSAGMPRRVFRWSEPGTEYCYEVGLCETISNLSENRSAVVRYKGDCEVGQGIVYGRLDQASFSQKPPFSMLKYEGGEACDGNLTRSVMIIFTNASNAIYQTKAFDETDSSCSTPLIIVHSFQMTDNSESSTSQPATTTKHNKTDDDGGWSSGGIFCLVIFIFALIYLIGGICYRRFVLHATGLNQIPNYTFWQKIGSLAADGCDMCCRCRDISQTNRSDGFPSYGASIQPQPTRTMSPTLSQSPRISFSETPFSHN